MLNVVVPVAHFVSYNTARYVVPAFEALGHSARIINQAELYGDLEGVDLIFGVDSGGALDFPQKHRPKCAMWFIDSRRNCSPDLRNPDDDLTAYRLYQAGGWVFQAQRLDRDRLLDQAIDRVTWLPLAADPEVWRPVGTAPKVHDVVFCGNVWDTTRANLLGEIRGRWDLEVAVGEPEGLAEHYSRGRLGFNISSFYGTDVAYDVNMRVFEVMACGIPLVTNALVDLGMLGFQNGYTHMEYLDPAGALQAIEWILAWEQAKRDNMGQLARQIIKEGHTYRHRIQNALEVLAEGGIIDL